MADIPISNVLRRAVYSGSAGTGPYQGLFEILDDDDVGVYLNATLLTKTTHYTISINANGTFEVTLVSAATGSDTVTLVGAKVISRTSDFSTGGDFFAATVNTELDNLTIFAQQLSERVDRSLKGAFTDATDLDMSLPAAATRASKYLAFNSDGEPVASSGTESSEIISTFSETLLDDESASDWLTTLGFSAFVQTLKDAASQSALNTLLGMSTYFKTLLGAASASAFRTLIEVFSADETWPTGRVRLLVGTTAAAGWVLLDDGTIGNASSGATTRANADTEDLFVHLWTVCADGECPVSTGRGASAAADFAANKTIGLPKTVGRVLGVYGSGSGLTARDLGETTGTETHQLTVAEMPAHAHPGSTVSGAVVGTGGNQIGYDANNTNLSTTLSIASQGGDDPHNNMQPSSFLNAEIKL
jgi:hypothetical protein